MSLNIKIRLALGIAALAYKLPEWVYGRAFIINVMFGYMIINSMHEAHKRGSK